MDDPNQTPSPQQDPATPDVLSDMDQTQSSVLGPQPEATLPAPEPTPPVIPSSTPLVPEFPQAPPPISDFEEQSFFAGKLPLILGIIVLLAVISGGFYVWQAGLFGGSKGKTNEVQVTTPARIIPPPPPPQRSESGFAPEPIPASTPEAAP